MFRFLISTQEVTRQVCEKLSKVYEAMPPLKNAYVRDGKLNFLLIILSSMTLFATVGSLKMIK